MAAQTTPMKPIGIFARVDAKTAEEIRELAEHNDRSVSAEVARAVRFYLASIKEQAV